MSTLAAPPSQDTVLGSLPTSLPAVERRAALPAGFVVGAATAGIKPSGRPDLAVVATTRGPAAAAAVFTANPFAAAPVRLSREHLARTGGTDGGPTADRRDRPVRRDLPGGPCFGWARAIVSTSGSANAATGPAGDLDQLTIAGFIGAALRAPVEEVLCLSTGVIGVRLPVERVGAAVTALVPDGLSPLAGALEDAALALMTTDTRAKLATTSVQLPDADGRPVAVTVAGVAKGVGMIHPRMATMLAIVVTDAAIQPEVLAELLRPAVARTWDQLSIDGDTSTNDTAVVLASGASAAAPVEAASSGALALGRAIEAVARDLARQQAADGEGATTLIACEVSGARDDADARAVARSVISSSLVKTAVLGRDPNWGRIAAAAGNARLADAAVLEAAGLPPDVARARAGRPAELEPDRLRIAVAGHLVFDGRAGGPADFERSAVAAAMAAPEVLIRLDLGLGPGRGEAFGCDLTEGYVRENAEYTT